MIGIFEHYDSLLENGNFIFDWDGTLFDSMTTKKNNFVRVVFDYLEGISVIPDQKILNDIFTELSGNPRRVIFEKMLIQSGHEINDAIYKILDVTLFELNKSKLKNCELFPDAIRLLHRLSQLNRNIYISSSVPQSELDYFFQLVVPPKYKHIFKAVLGGSEHFNKGDPHFSFIFSNSRIELNQFLFIGDDDSDVEIGQESDVPSLLIDRDKKGSGRISALSIKSLDVLCTKI